MTPSFSLPGSHRSLSLLLMTVLHLALLYVFLKSQVQPGKELDTSTGPAITWLRAIPPAPSTPVPRTVIQPISKPLSTHKSIAVSTLPAEPQTIAPALPPEQETAVPAAPAAVSAADILAQARRDVGKIDRDLRREFPHQGGIKLEDTAFKRMQQGFADAYAAVPPKWYEASRIEEIGSELTKGVRVYKITSALGSICITMHAGKNGESTIGNCPK